MDTEIKVKKLDITAQKLEMANKVYEDGLREPAKEIGKGLSFCLKFIGSIFSPTMYKYIKNAEYKKRQIDEELAKKYDLIPEENRVNPRMNIMGPAVELLKFNLDEEHIKDIFVNIMTNEMNGENQPYVLPAYIEIVKQLSKMDANMLKSIYYLYKAKNQKQFAMDIIRVKTGKYQHVTLDKYLIGEARKNENGVVLNSIKLDSLVMDNLCRLGLIKIYDQEILIGIDDYEMAFDKLKNRYHLDNKEDIYYDKGTIEITEFGINFLKICLE